MNKRLIWNFEILPKAPWCWPDSSQLSKEDYYWESRFFWSDEQIIPLIGLNDSFLEVTRYEIKLREDTYFLLPEQPYNIKARNLQLFYKPLLKKNPYILGFGKKIALDRCTHTEILPGQQPICAQTLVSAVQNYGKKILVKKEALIYTFPIKPKTKLELARLSIGNDHYFSVNIESRSSVLAEFITKQLFEGQQTTDYVSFLRSISC